MMLSQQWFGAIRQQAITWAHVDPVLCRHMVSLGLNELIPIIYIYKVHNVYTTPLMAAELNSY